MKLFLKAIFICTISLAPNLSYGQRPQLSVSTGKGPSRTRITTSKEWIQESLETHNYFRKFHNAAPLVLNDTLSEISQYYANRLLALSLPTLDAHGAGKVYFDHNPETQIFSFGENLYYSIMPSEVGPIPGQYAVLLWYEEIKDYNFTSTKRKTTSDPKALIGHLTQVLWKETLSMGTAYASKKLGNNVITFVVANYYPPQYINAENSYLKNVEQSHLSTPDINANIVTRNVQNWWPKREDDSSDTHESWRKAALISHNQYRKYHDSQPLRLNTDICRVSQQWAQYLLENERGLPAFNSRVLINQIESNYIATSVCNLGENSLFLVTAEKNIPAEMIVKVWYRQIKNYNFDTSQHNAVSNKQTSGFQQIVWADTTEFCMSYATGMSENGQFLTYVVANYYPSISPMQSKFDNDRKRNIKQSAVNVIEEEENPRGSSVGTTFAIIFVVLLTVFLCTVVYIHRYKRAWLDEKIRNFSIRT